MHKNKAADSPVFLVVDVQVDVVAAARRANAAAAEAVSRLGPARSPRRDEIDALLGCGSCRDRPDPQ